MLALGLQGDGAPRLLAVCHSRTPARNPAKICHGATSKSAQIPNAASQAPAATAAPSPNSVPLAVIDSSADMLPLM